MTNYYAYEVFDPLGGYCLYIHQDPDTYDLQFKIDIDESHDHFRAGFVKAESVQEAIQCIANDAWLYQEYNQP